MDKQESKCSGVMGWDGGGGYYLFCTSNATLLLEM